ncbi:MAG: hypothetical protein ACJAQT_003832 [Akkermansiaceae bacterium]|jgi:hypothetical protein
MLALSAVFAEDLKFFIGEAAAIVGVVDGEVFRKGAISKGSFVGQREGGQGEEDEKEAEHGVVVQRDAREWVCVTKIFHDVLVGGGWKLEEAVAPLRRDGRGGRGKMFGGRGLVIEISFEPGND